MIKRKVDWRDDSPRPRKRHRPPLATDDPDPDLDEYPEEAPEDNELPDGLLHQLTDQLAQLNVGRVVSPVGIRRSPTE